jgi:hypothetical protein
LLLSLGEGGILRPARVFPHVRGLQFASPVLEFRLVK